MKYLTKLALFLFLFNVSAIAQITVSVNGSNSTEVFTIAGEKVNLGKDSFLNSASALSVDINSLTGISAVLQTNGVDIHSSSSEQLFSSQVSAAPGDESLKIYARLNGSFIIRENIANFLFFDESGSIEQSISNSSQSTEGESVSELAADPAFKTVVLYNPKIVRDQIEGSRARIVKPNWTTSDIFYSGDRAIRFVKVSDNGQLIAVVSYKDGEDDKVDVMDRFGNELETFSFNQTVADLRFSEDGEFITIRSNSRVGVYSVLDGEREGSTSFRSMLHFAEYVPQDNTIIALTADIAGSVLSGVEFHAINVEARAIERQDYNGQLGITDLLSVSLDRTGSNSYSITGLSKGLNLKVSF